MWPPTGLIPWFSKTEGNTDAALLHHPFLFKEKLTQCSRGSMHYYNCNVKFWKILEGSSQSNNILFIIINQIIIAFIIFIQTHIY